MIGRSIVLMNEPLTPNAATALIRSILTEGQVAFSQHAIDELTKDGLTTVDAVNVMRAGAVKQAADYIKQSWRYRVETARMAVVVAFRSEDELVVVTAWRAKR
jgi:hypothetical protein